MSEAKAISVHHYSLKIFSYTKLPRHQEGLLLSVQGDRFVQISYSQRVRGESSQNSRPSFGFTEKVYGSVPKSIHRQW